MTRFLLAALAGSLLALPPARAADDAPPPATTLAPAAAPVPAPATVEPPASGHAASPELRFRRVYAPAARINDWPLGGVPYLPVDSQDFDRLLAAVHNNDRGAPRATGAQLLRAVYRARLRAPDVLEGEATLSVEHRTTTPVLLALDPLGLAVSQATWSLDSAPRAVLGRSSDGRVGVMVEQSGDLQLNWTLRGERGPSGEMTFALELPACPAGHLTVDLPANLVPSVERGLVRQDQRPDNAQRRWSIDVGGGRRQLLRLSSTDSVRPRKPLALVRETTAYEFSPRGVDVSVQLRLDVHDAPLERLEVQIDPRLRLVAARYADRDIPWTTAAGPGGTGTRAILELPEPILGTGRVVRLSALAPLEEDQRWRLPFVRAESTTWLEGTVQVVVPKPLVIAQLTTAGCRQSKAVPLGAPLAGESMEFQCFSPDAAIDVVVGRPRDALHADLGCDVELSAVEIKCRTIAELTLRQGEEFAVAAEIGPQWLIDSVESSGADVIEDWQIETRDGGPPRLVVSLKKGVSSSRPVRLTIAGHRVAQSVGGLGIAELEMLRFQGAELGKQFLALRASDAQELQLSGADQLVRLDPLQFAPAEARLFAEPPTGLVFAITPLADRLRVGTAPRRPGYTGDINIDVLIDGSNLTETFIFRCVPQASRLDRVLVFCSPARAAPLRFSLAGGSSGQVSARRLPTEDYTSLGAAPAGEVWEVTLRLPRTAPFEIRAVRTVPLDGKTPLVLASLPEAASSRGTVAVRALGETSVTIDNQRLKPIPAELSQPELYQTARGAFRYEPARDAGNPDPAILVSAAPSNSRSSGAWVWQARLDSRYILRESTEHLASFRVQTAGRPRLSFTLPPGAELRGVAVDQVPLAASVVPRSDGALTVDLPAGKQFASVVLQFVTTPGDIPRCWGSILPAWPEVDVPVLSRRWKLWLPAGMELSESDTRWESPAIESPTWSQRLFGPLGRSSRQSMFDPLAATDWRALLGHDGVDQAARSSWQQFHTALAAALAGAENSPEQLSWGELLGRVSATLAAADITVLADVPGLNQMALVPETRLVVPAAAVGRDRALAALEQARVFVLAGPQSIVLTSESAAGDYRSQIVTSGDRQWGWLLPGPLADALDPTAHGGGSPRVEAATQWAAGPVGPWPPTPAALSPSWDSRGWNTYTLGWQDGPAVPVRVVNKAAMQSLSWGVFLLVLAIAVWARPNRLHALVLAAALFAAVGLLVSPALVPITAAGFLAAICGVLFAATERYAARRHRTPGNRRKSMVPASALLLALTAFSSLALGVIGAAAQTPPAAAQTPPAADPAPAESVDRTPAPQAPTTAAGLTAGNGRAASAVERVFVPVDEAQVPVGTKVYVPLEFYNGLLRQVAAASEQPGDWLLTRAAYRAVLSPAGAQKGVAAAEFKATYDLQVFRPHAEVKLPLTHDALVLVAGSAKLDGRSVEVNWPDGQRVLSLAVDQPGIYRLELGFEPVLRSEGGMTGFELAIPSLPEASLSVSSLGDPAAVEVIGARGAISSVKPDANLPGAGDHELHADVGPSDRIGLRWPDEKNLPASLPNLDVEELIWVKLQPGSPVVDARFKFRVVDGKVRRVRILADPRLRLLPSWHGASAVTALHTLPGDPETIELELSASAGDQVVVDLTFLVAGTSGIGSFRLPRLEAAGARLTGRLLAITVDPALHWEEQIGDEVRPLTPADFSAAWGETTVKPQLVYAIPRGEAAWSLGTRPRENRSTVEQSVTLDLGSQQGAVELSAAINTTAGHQFQVRLSGPPGLEVDYVSLLDEGVERLARWAKGDAGAITAFLTGPVSGRQQFKLRGRLRIPPAGDFTFPGFEWPAAEVKRSELQVFRQPQALVEIEPPANMTALDPSLVERNGPERGRLVAAYAIAGPQPALKLKLSPNNPDAEVREMIIVEREQDVWTATVDCQVTVRSGLVDVLRFEIPPSWSEPYQLDRTAARLEIVPIPGESRRQLVVVPAEPIAESYSVRIRGRMVPSTGDRLRAPDVILRGAAKLERFVALPSEWERQQLDWEMTGLAPSTLAVDGRARRGRSQPLSVYQVLGERFQAALKSVERASGRPRIRLADISAAWHADGTYAGVASFDLDPAGAAQVVLTVPAQVELVHVSVSGLAVSQAPAGPDSWRLPLQSTQLPQRIEAVFRGTWSGRGAPMNRVQLPAPGIEGVEVDHTLWTVYAPLSAGPAAPLESSGILTPVRQELSRLEATESILDLASHVASDQALEEVRRWYAPWNARFVAARNRIQRLSRFAARPSAARDQELDALNRQEQAIAERLGVGPGSPEEPTPQAESALLLDTLCSRSQEPVRYASDGDLPALTLRYPHALGSHYVSRLLVALAAVALGALLFRTLRGRKLAIAPWAAALLLGMLAWLWLEPSALGLAVVLGSLAAVLTRRWRGAQPNRPSTLAT